MPAPTTLPSPPLASSPAQAPASLPPLENGDRLTRDEFERRYEAMPKLKKAELIEGVVHMASAVRFRHHGRPHAHLIGWLVHYEASTPGVEAGDNSTARMDLDNEPQPDALLLIEPARGGQAIIDADDYVKGAPELVAEVPASRASYDLHAKLTVYRRNGVREYLVWRVLDRAIDWFVPRGGQFVPLAPAGGLLKSEVFPGLWLDPEALVAGDMTRVLAVLQQGLNSPEHAAFVTRLNLPAANS